MRKLHAMALVMGLFACAPFSYGQLVQEIQPTGLMQDDFYGSAVALNADATWLIVGRPGYDIPGNGNNVDNEGAFYIFNRPNGQFTVNSTAFFLSDLSDDAALGTSVTINDAGNLVAIGAPFDGPSPTANGQVRGSIHIYQGNGMTWNRLPAASGVSVIVNPSSVQNKDNHGFSVSFDGSGNYLATGAPAISKIGAGGNSYGQAFVYFFDGTNWLPATKINNAANEEDDDLFGFSVALDVDGNSLVIGAPGLNGGGLDRGRAFVVTRNGTWGTPFSLPLPAGGINNLAALGTSVDINDAGNVIAVGCPKCVSPAGDTTGAVFVYRFNAMAWNLEKEIFPLVADGGSEDDFFGTSVSINGAGDFILVGSPGDGLNGSVSSFQYVGGTDVWLRDTRWTKEAADPLHPGVLDLFGTAVSLSRTNRWGAVGAPGHDIQDPPTPSPPHNIGSAYVFQPAALPVTWLSFRATLEGSSVHLSWSTASEAINEGFAVQRSANGRDWHTIHFEEGAGTTSEVQHYSYIDPSPFTLHASLVYYRLEQRDEDGATDYSPVRVIELGTGGGIRVFPNPASEVVTVAFGEVTRVRGTLRLLNGNGRLVAEHTIPVGTTEYQLRVAQLPSGTYLLEVKVGNQEWTKRVIVE